MIDDNGKRGVPVGPRQFTLQYCIMQRAALIQLVAGDTALISSMAYSLEDDSAWRWRLWLFVASMDCSVDCCITRPISRGCIGAALPLDLGGGHHCRQASSSLLNSIELNSATDCEDFGSTTSLHIGVYREVRWSSRYFVGRSAIDSIEQ